MGCPPDQLGCQAYKYYAMNPSTTCAKRVVRAEMGTLDHPTASDAQRSASSGHIDGFLGTLVDDAAVVRDRVMALLWFPSSGAHQRHQKGSRNQGVCLPVALLVLPRSRRCPSHPSRMGLCVPSQEAVYRMGLVSDNGRLTLVAPWLQLIQLTAQPTVSVASALSRVPSSPAGLGCGWQTNTRSNHVNSILR